MVLTDLLALGRDLPFLFGIGLLLAAAATWFTGIALNQSVPRRRLAAVMELREAELEEYVEHHTFSLGPGYPPPQDEHEARRMAKTLLAHEQAEAMKELTNRHTFFFVPMQHWGFVLGSLGIVSLISDAVR